MLNRIYNEYEDVEEDVKKNAPQIVFKYRSWRSGIHKNLLKEKQVWFSHPYDLNDELDARPPYKFDKNEIQSQKFFQYLLDTVPEEYRNEDEKKRIALEQWEKIKPDPQSFFDANRSIIERREMYNQIGIFSTSYCCLNKKIWELYGDNHCGYTIGFKTNELAKELNVSMGKVIYSDDPFPYSMLGNHDKFDLYRYKTKKWEYENEFRFFTAGIDIYTSRIRKFSTDTAVEAIIGFNATKETETEILKILQERYNPGIAVYKTFLNDSNELCRSKIGSI